MTALFFATTSLGSQGHRPSRLGTIRLVANPRLSDSASDISYPRRPSLSPTSSMDGDGASMRVSPSAPLYSFHARIIASGFLNRLKQCLGGLRGAV